VGCVWSLVFTLNKIRELIKLKMNNPNWELVPDCCFCKDIAVRKQDLRMKKEEFANVICHESRNFVAFPSVSPLAAGHSLIVPKRHVTSMAQIPKQHVSEFITFATRVQARISEQFGSVACFEHGVGRFKTGGCGVTHAHLHLLPMAASTVNATRGKADEVFRLEAVDSMARFFDLNLGGKSYVLFGRVDGELAYSTSENIPSQFLRKTIAHFLGVIDWDWRLFANWNAFKNTHNALINAA
jgi:diadenosine tetraphosphate (Ap4A) HIT family hydrolase